MSSSGSVNTSSDFPVAAIVCLAIGGYALVIFIIIFVRQLLRSRGMCADSECNLCGTPGEQCCGCCISLSERCNCCQCAGIDNCLEKCCPDRKNVNCVDMILCQCSDEPNCCSKYDGRCYECYKHLMACTGITCCCFEIKLKNTPRSARRETTTSIPVLNVPELATSLHSSTSQPRRTSMAANSTVMQPVPQHGDFSRQPLDKLEIVLQQSDDLSSHMQIPSTYAQTSMSPVQDRKARIKTNHQHPRTMK